MPTSGRRIYDDYELTSDIRKYPNPFFDLSKEYIPKSIKTLFKYCRTFYYTNGFINNVINKMTEYPITDILYENTTSREAKEKYRDYFSKYLRLKSFLIEVGLDYFVFGNCFVSVNMKFKRYLKCTRCGETQPIESIPFKFKNYKFKGKCQKCKIDDVTFTIRDTAIKNEEGLKFIRWAPENIDVSYDPFTGESEYYYSLDARIKNGIRNGKPEIVAKVPELFIKGVKENKKILLEKSNLYHFKRPTLAEEGMGWGKPVVLSALKSIYYLQTLRRGNEAIATEHIIPKKALFPQPTGTVDPMTMMSLSKWTGQLKAQVRKWKTDPNNIAIFPIPIGYQALMGEGKALLLFPELKFVEEEVINSLGMNSDMVRGSTSWTSSSISLRIMENHFLVYRELLLDFVNEFLIKKIKQNLQYPAAEIKFRRFRMSDDTEAKNILVNLNANNKISDNRMWDELGYDPEDEQRLKEKSLDNELQLEQKKQQKLAEIQGEAQITLGKYQVRAQSAAQNEQFLIKEKLFEKELAEENAGTDMDMETLVQTIADKLGLLPPEIQSEALKQLAKKQPVTFALVLHRIEMEKEMLAREEVEMGVSPEQQKQQGQTQPKTKKVEGKKDKHQAQTRGNP